jgi:hypothetical protein
MVRRVRDAFPLKRGWLYLAVDPGNNFCYLNYCGGRQNNNKRASPMRF